MDADAPIGVFDSGVGGLTVLRALMKRVHKNVAVVALANKLARITWAVLRRGEEFAATARAAT